MLRRRERERQRLADGDYYVSVEDSLYDTSQADESSKNDYDTRSEEESDSQSEPLVSANLLKVLISGVGGLALNYGPIGNADDAYKKVTNHIEAK